MFHNGTILYLFLFALLARFWWRVRGLSFNELLDRSAQEHHVVLDVAMKHPRGGTWKQHQRWMQEVSHDH